MLRRLSLGIALYLMQSAATHGAPIGPLPEFKAVAPLSVLYANRATLWANAGRGRIDIDVCWVNPNSAPGATSAERAAWRDLRRRAVEEWSRHARINFRGWDGNDPVNHPTACANRAPGLHIVICTLPKDARCPALPKSQSEPGGYPKDNGLSNGVRLNPQHGPGVATHEFGHTLGLYHEEERPDAPAISSGPCKKQSWPNDHPLHYGAYDKTGVMSYCEPAGAAPRLSPNDIASIQRLYGRRTARSLVAPRGKCADVPNGSSDHAAAIVSDCNESIGEQLTAVAIGTRADAWHIRLGAPQNPRPKCLVAANPGADAAIESGACGDGSAWRFEDIYVQGFGGLCLDVLAGKKVAGTPIQTWVCGALKGANQRWTRTHAGQMQYAGTNFCAQVGPKGLLQLAPCDANDSAQKFTFGDAAIRQGGTCLEARGPTDAEHAAGSGLPINGSPIQAAPCNSSLIQKWNFSGALRYDAAPTLCLARRADTPGSPLHLASCRDGSELQVWDYHF